MWSSRGLKGWEGRGAVAVTYGYDVWPYRRQFGEGAAALYTEASPVMAVSRTLAYVYEYFWEYSFSETLKNIEK